MDPQEKQIYPWTAEEGFYSGYHIIGRDHVSDDIYVMLGEYPDQNNLNKLVVDRFKFGQNFSGDKLQIIQKKLISSRLLDFKTSLLPEYSFADFRNEINENNSAKFSPF